MIGKTLIATAAMMMAVTAESSTIDNTQQVAIAQESEALTGIPDNTRIMADLIGHQMYVSEGLPGVWEFSSPADIQNGNIGSSRLNGDWIEFNFTLLLVDNKSEQRNIYRAETLVTYKKTNQSWELVNIQDLTFKATGAASSIVTQYIDGDC